MDFPTKHQAFKMLDKTLREMNYVQKVINNGDYLNHEGQICNMWFYTRIELVNKLKFLNSVVNGIGQIMPDVRNSYHALQLQNNFPDRYLGGHWATKQIAKKRIELHKLEMYRNALESGFSYVSGKSYYRNNGYPF